MEENLKNFVVLSKEEYNELLEIKTKYTQYKNYILKTANNNNLTKMMIAIEGKNLYELIEEDRREK
ncbi:MAG: hypothetical protein KIC54_03290 [Clostridium sp.]|jgi:hypothetical protein|nr:hypothetical protein [Clostridium sp.]